CICSMLPQLPRATLFPYTTLFRSENISSQDVFVTGNTVIDALMDSVEVVTKKPSDYIIDLNKQMDNREIILITGHRRENHGMGLDRKSTRLNSSHVSISYAVFCLK